jgi:hypothetical protein
MSASVTPLKAAGPAATAPPGGITGVRPALGAAAFGPTSAQASSEALLLMNLAAPEDGRAPARAASGEIPGRGFPAGLAVCVLLGAIGGLVLFWFDPRQYHFYPICLLHQTTGLLCPGCGALRATHQLLHGHLTTAFRFNPVLIVFLPFFVWLGARCGHQLARSQKVSIGVRPIWLWLILTAVLVVSVVRNLPGAPFAMLRP